MKPLFLKTFSFLSLITILIITQGNNTLYSHDVCKITICVTDCGGNPVADLLVDVWDRPRDQWGAMYWGGTTGPNGCTPIDGYNLSQDVVYYVYLNSEEPYQTFIACDANICGHCHAQTINLVYGSCDSPFNNSLIPSVYSLKQNFPNPFNPNTSINFSIAKPDNVKIVVYDVLGNEVLVLVNEFRTAGVYDINFDASALSSGIYFYTLTSGNFTETKKMLLIK